MQREDAAVAHHRGEKRFNNRGINWKEKSGVVEKSWLRFGGNVR